MSDNNVTPIVTSADIQTLQDNKLGALSLEKSKKMFTKEMVFKYGPLWWDEFANAMVSDDKDMKRMAMVEFNKLQCRVLPTEITGADGEQMVLNVINYTKPKLIESNDDDGE